MSDIIEVMDELPMGIMQAVHGVSYRIEVPGVIGFRSDDIASPFVNVLGQTRASNENIDEIIDQVLKSFNGNPFSWLIGPSSTPTNLRLKLESKGLIYYNRMLGMVLDDLNVSVSINSEIDIVQVSTEEAAEYSQIFASSFGMGMSPEAIQFTFISSRNTRIYLAFSKQSDIPIGFASMTYISSEYVLLGGSAVSEAWRGNRVYKTLVKRRLNDAKLLGRTKVLIQAFEDTSAPMCKKLGFYQICDFDIYLGNVSNQV
ncbi:hypothetical protein PMSD_19075 [Paenibacillus macquariensis subsp. defensor]|nr:hypothetical protein PMSD_19075 [Paenibacillus macquariensis subsp. defensor]